LNSSSSLPPVLAGLLEKHGFTLIHAQSLDSWASGHANALVFFPGDLNRHAESSDLAVILPELLKNFPTVQAGLVDPESEAELHRRFRFDAWPALVLLRHGQYLGVISRLRNWVEYLQEMNQLLAGQPVRLPGIGIPVVSDPASGPH
jgi:hydrogenase-1 operon protein HyaE